MFELFKKRDFGELFNDTFGLLRLKWKNYFGNYLKINFLIMVIFMVFAYFFSEFYSKALFGGVDNPEQFRYIEEFVTLNATLIGWAGIGMFILIMILSIIQISYPIMYLKLIENDVNYNPKTNEISTLIKQNFGRLLLFGFLTFIVVGILASIAFVLSFFLIFLVIGIFLLMILVPYISALIYLSMFHYIHKKSDYFDALGFAFNTIHNNFWKVIGSNLVLHLIIQIANMIITSIPAIIIFTMGFVSMQETGDADASFMTITFAVIYGISILLSMFMNNLIVVNFGLVYYGELERKESVFANSEIDQIGLDE